MTRISIGCSGLFLAALLFGCGQADKAAPTASRPAEAASPYVLEVEPAGAQPVAELRKSAKDDQQVVVVGRVGGSEEPILHGAAAFSLVDLALKPCQDGCETPWDYCCESKEKMTGGKAMVKVVDQAGRPLAADARKLLGLKELSEVVVRGKAKRDEAGNLTVLVDGVYVRP